jgi:hypothetical protein
MLFKYSLKLTVCRNDLFMLMQLPADILNILPPLCSLTVYWSLYTILFCARSLMIFSIVLFYAHTVCSSFNTNLSYTHCLLFFQHYFVYTYCLLFISYCSPLCSVSAFFNNVLSDAHCLLIFCIILFYAHALCAHLLMLIFFRLTIRLLFFQHYYVLCPLSADFYTTVFFFRLTVFWFLYYSVLCLLSAYLAILLFLMLIVWFSFCPIFLRYLVFVLFFQELI